MLIPLFGVSTTYYTLSDGNYSDPAWSLDGINPCFCAPDCGLIGELVYHNEVNFNSGNNTLAVDVNPNTYIIEINNNTNTYVLKKMIFN